MTTSASAAGERPRVAVVLGMHRSGTSAIARGLQVVGVELGDRLEPAAAGINDKGYWEDLEIVALNVDMLATLQRGWDCLLPLDPAEIERLCATGFVERAAALLRDKCKARSVFGFKDPRTALLLPVWQRVFALGGFDARYVIALRNPLSVVRSLAKRDGFDATVSCLVWVNHMMSVLSGIGGCPAVVVDYDRLMASPEAELRRIAALLGTTTDAHALELYRQEFLDESLRHSLHHVDELRVDRLAVGLAAAVYEFLAEAAAGRIRIDARVSGEAFERLAVEWRGLRPVIELADRQRDRIASAERKLMGHERAIAELNERAAETERVLQARLVEQEAGFRASKQQLMASIDAIHSSLSWRATEPVRRLVTAVRSVPRAFGLVRKAVRQGGGFAKTVRLTWQVVRREGVAGLTARLQWLGSQASPASDASAEHPSPSIERLRVVPCYVDPDLEGGPAAVVVVRKVAVHLHLLYEDLLETMAERLANVPTRFDLYVSVAAADAERVQARLRVLLPAVDQLVVELVPNQGRDLAPMIVQFGRRLVNYDIVGHFHTERSPHDTNLHDCLTHLLDTLLGPPRAGSGRVAWFFRRLREDAKVVFAAGCTHILEDATGWGDNRFVAGKILKRFTRLSLSDFPEVEFPAGSMFWARGACIRDLLLLPISFADFPREPIPPDGSLAPALERMLLVFASGHPGKCLRIHEGDSIPDYRHYEPARDFSALVADSDVKVLSYYLPQFHSIAENDAWHGVGFTEWTKVRAANPLFHGHHQQHIPHPDLGYYLLDSPATLHRQAAMMRQAGVHGQVFYHYWFGGKLILEKPARMLLAAADVPMRFCFCWANENWTRRWDGNEQEVLLAQDYSAADARAFIRYLIPFFRDPRHLRIEGRPMLFVYRPSSIPDPKAYVDAWREECALAGLPPPYVVATLTRGAEHPADFGMDAAAERVLHDWTAGGAPEIKGRLSPYGPLDGSVLSYDDVADHYSRQVAPMPFTRFRSLIPIWDNTARYGKDAYLVHGSSPERFQSWLTTLVQQARRDLPADRRFVLVNAWNEWAEGAHLEPDTRYGYAYLNAVGRSLVDLPYAGTRDPRVAPAAVPRVHLSFPAHLLRRLDAEPELADRFWRALTPLTLSAVMEATADTARVRAALPQAKEGRAEDADFVLEFRRLGISSPRALLEMLEVALASPGSVVISQGYDSGTPLVAETANQSVAATVAHDAPHVLYPKEALRDGIRNIRISRRTLAFLRETTASTVRHRSEVTTILRVHKKADLELLRNALCSLAAMRSCVVSPLIAAQDLGPEQTASVEAMLAEFAWAAGAQPRVVHYRSTPECRDLRSRMLNESLRQVQTRHAAFLDYDDLLFPDAYEWLLERLRSTGRAVAFGRVFDTTYDNRIGRLIERRRTFEFGYSYSDFVNLNHAPLHSFLLDLEQLDPGSVVYHDDQKYMEDYYLTLQLFSPANCDWDSLRCNHYVGDYLHSVDRAHTLALVDDAKRQALLADPEYMRCEGRIHDLRRWLAQHEVAPRAEA